MPNARSNAENRLITTGGRLAKCGQQLATAQRQHEHTGAIIDSARAEVIRAIVDVAPLLTDEQRAQLRPLLAGTLPAITQADAGAA